MLEDAETVQLVHAQDVDSGLPLGGSHVSPLILCHNTKFTCMNGNQHGLLTSYVIVTSQGHKVYLLKYQFEKVVLLANYSLPRVSILNLEGSWYF